MIRLICQNTDCNYSYHITEKELTGNFHYHKFCLICGSRIEVAKESLEKVVKQDLYKKAEENINDWVKDIGWDNTLDLINRNKNKISICNRIVVIYAPTESDL